jgi:glycolate oxidase subunit GlcD
VTVRAGSAVAGLAAVVGDDALVTDGRMRPYLHDATEARGLTGSADAVVLPGDAAQVAAVMAWCYEHGVAITPQGGRTGYAGGAVPQGGVAVSLERLRDVRAFDPLLWRAEIEAGVTTADVRRRARENGLFFPVDPGAAEQSHLGGNVATNAGGPHAFKYGVTGAWVTGIEAVIPPGEIVRLGGFARKDVAGYDLRSLLIGSEGTLGLITSVSLRFIPSPEAALPLIASYADERAGADAVTACLASGVIPAALEYLDSGAVDVVRASYPGSLPAEARFVVITEADGTPAEAAAGRAALREVLAPRALAIDEPSDLRGIGALWRWRDGVGLAADAALGGKVSEDIAVPNDRLGDAIEGTREIAARHDVRSCSWGHAGDGNLHSTFMFSRENDEERRRALAAAEELFPLAIGLGGTISGEHGLGLAKSGQLREQWPERAVELHRQVKALFDPKGLLNPGKKLA